VSEEIGPGLNWAQEEDRLMVSKVVLKMADISSPCKNWELHSRWTERIAEEFYQQAWMISLTSLVRTPLLYCIVFIHAYSASHSMSLSEELPTTAIVTVSEFTCRIGVQVNGNYLWNSIVW